MQYDRSNDARADEIAGKLQKTSPLGQRLLTLSMQYLVVYQRQNPASSRQLLAVMPADLQEWLNRKLAPYKTQQGAEPEVLIPIQLARVVALLSRVEKFIGRDDPNIAFVQRLLKCFLTTDQK